MATDREIINRLCLIPRGLKDYEVDWIEAMSKLVIDYGYEMTETERRKAQRILRKFRNGN